MSEFEPASSVPENNDLSSSIDWSDISSIPELLEHLGDKFSEWLNKFKFWESTSADVAATIMPDTAVSMAIIMDPSVIPSSETVPVYSSAREAPLFQWCRLVKNGREQLFYCEPSTNDTGRVMVKPETMSYVTGMGYRAGGSEHLEQFLERQLVPVQWPSTFTGDLDPIRVNPHMSGRLNQVFRQLEQEGISYHIHSAGCYCFRGVRGLGRQQQPDYIPTESNHALGLAIDINPSSNPYESGSTTDMPARMIEIFEAHGFAWGGRWNPPDLMHFQLPISALT